MENTTIGTVKPIRRSFIYRIKKPSNWRACAINLCRSQSVGATSLQPDVIHAFVFRRNTDGRVLRCNCWIPPFLDLRMAVGKRDASGFVVVSGRDVDPCARGASRWIADE